MFRHSKYHRYRDMSTIDTISRIKPNIFHDGTRGGSKKEQNVDKYFKRLVDEMTNVPDNFLDPLHQSLMDDPVAVSSGHIFDRSSVMDRSTGKLKFRHCPLSKTLLDDSVIHLVLLQREIDSFKTKRDRNVREIAIKMISYGNQASFREVIESFQKYMCTSKSDRISHPLVQDLEAILSVTREESCVAFIAGSLKLMSTSKCWKTLASSMVLQDECFRIIASARDLQVYYSHGTNIQSSGLFLTLYNERGLLKYRCKLFNGDSHEKNGNQSYEGFGNNDEIVSKAKRGDCYKVEFVSSESGGVELHLNSFICKIIPQSAKESSYRTRDHDYDPGIYMGTVNTKNRAHGKGVLDYDNGERFVGFFHDGYASEGVLYRGKQSERIMRQGGWTTTLGGALEQKYPSLMQVCNITDNPLPAQKGIEKHSHRGLHATRGIGRDGPYVPHRVPNRSKVERYTVHSKRSPDRDCISLPPHKFNTIHTQAKKRENSAERWDGDDYIEQRNESHEILEQRDEYEIGTERNRSEYAADERRNSPSAFNTFHSKSSPSRNFVPAPSSHYSQRHTEGLSKHQGSYKAMPRYKSGSAIGRERTRGAFADERRSPVFDASEDMLPFRARGHEKNLPQKTHNTQNHSTLNTPDLVWTNGAGETPKAASVHATTQNPIGKVISFRKAFGASGHRQSSLRPMIFSLDTVFEKSGKSFSGKLIKGAILQDSIAKVLVSVEKVAAKGLARIDLVLYDKLEHVLESIDVFGNLAANAIDSPCRVITEVEPIVSKAKPGCFYQLEYIFEKGIESSLMLEGLLCKIIPSSNSTSFFMIDPKGRPGRYFGPVDSNGGANGEGSFRCENGSNFEGEFRNGRWMRGVYYKEEEALCTMKNGTWDKELDMELKKEFPNMCKEPQKSEKTLLQNPTEDAMEEFCKTLIC